MSQKITILKDDDYDLNDDLPAELDIDKLRFVRRGPKTDAVTITLAPDVAEVFGTSEAVNEALRTLIRVIGETRKAA
ncbi:MAG: hypothetical protein ACKV2V_13465 [Blastocatellia bacterium]